MIVSCVPEGSSDFDFGASDGEGLVSFLALVVSFGELLVSERQEFQGLQTKWLGPNKYIAIWAKNRTEKWRFGAEFWKFLGRPEPRREPRKTRITRKGDQGSKAGWVVVMGDRSWLVVTTAPHPTS